MYANTNGAIRKFHEVSGGPALLLTGNIQKSGGEGVLKKKRLVEMAKSCKGLAMELVKCLSESDCVKVFIFILFSYFLNFNFCSS